MTNTTTGTTANIGTLFNNVLKGTMNRTSKAFFDLAQSRTTVTGEEEAMNNNTNNNEEMHNMETTTSRGILGTAGHYVGMAAGKVWSGAKYVYHNLKGRVIPLTVYTASAFGAVAVTTTVGGALLATAAISAATMAAIYMLIAKIKKEKIQFRVAVLAMLIHGFSSAITLLSFFLFGIIPTLVADLVISYIQVEAVKFI